MLLSCYMSWRSKKQNIYFSILVLIILGILFLFLYPVFNKTPTCFDGKQNGTETGVDCGGSCANFCQNEVKLPFVDFASVFPVSEGVYNALVVLVSNNVNAGSKKAPYTITLYDSENKVITEIKDETFIPTSSRFSVFYPQIRTGQRLPVKIVFRWQEDKITFEKLNFNNNILPIEESFWTRNTLLGVERVSVTLSNNSFFDIPETEYVVVLYDENDEPIASSKTIAGVKARSNQVLYFSWPYEFNKEPKRQELIRNINPFLYAR